MNVCATGIARSVKSVKTGTALPREVAHKTVIVTLVKPAKMGNALLSVGAPVARTLNAQHRRFVSFPPDKLRAAVVPWLGNGVLVIRIASFETVKTHVPQAPAKADSARSVNLVIAVETLTAAAITRARHSAMIVKCA